MIWFGLIRLESELFGYYYRFITSCWTSISCCERIGGFVELGFEEMGNSMSLFVGFQSLENETDLKFIRPSISSYHETFCENL